MADTTSRPPTPVAGPDSLLTSEQFAEIAELLPTVDSVELKLSIADTDHRSTVQALGMDVLDAHIRQVVFYDTRDLTLYGAGVMVRARRIQARPGDVVVKLRPVVPEHLPAAVLEAETFGIEVDILPGGFVRSGSMKSPASDRKLKQLLAHERPLRKVLSHEQRAFYLSHAPHGVELDDLIALGPVNVLKLKFRPPDFHRKMVAELWLYPDGSRILELSTKCAPADAFVAGTECREYLDGHGVDLGTPQQTKTRSALTYFARQASGDSGNR